VHMLTEPGAPPVRTRPSFGDMPSAMTLACGIMVALVARERLGIGQAVDVSLFNCGVWALSVDILECLSTKQDIDPGKESAFFNPLYNFYKTKDGRWILLTRTVRPPTDPDPYWQSVCQALEREDLDSDPRFNSSQKRSENALALIDVFNEAFAQKTLEEWETRLDEFGLFFAPIHKPIEVVKDPQARANNFFETFNHPVYGPIEVPGAPIKLSETPGSFRTPSPSLGQHSDEILLGLGYSRDEISSLRDKKVI
jgi:CoA:oxalate CoA-transferase